MSQKIEWKVEVDDSGAVVKMEELRKVAGSTEKDFEGVGRGASKAESHLSGLSSAFSKLKSASMWAVGGLAAGAGVLAESSFSKTEEMGEEIEKISSITGMGAQQSMLFAAATKARGLSAESTANAYKYLGKNMKAAEVQQESFENSQISAAESGEVFRGRLGLTAAAFKKLGVSVGELRHMNADEQFHAVIHAFSQMADGAEKTRLETTLFGRGGTAMAQVLDDNALGMEHMLAVAKKAFPYLGENGTKSMEDLKIKTAEGKLYWEGLQTTLGLKLVPALDKAIPMFTNLVKQAEKGEGVFSQIGTEFHDIASFLQTIKGAAESVEKLFGMKGTGGALGAVSAALVADKLLLGGMGKGMVGKVLGRLGGGGATSVVSKVLGGGGASTAEGAAGAAAGAGGLGLGAAILPAGAAAAGGFIAHKEIKKALPGGVHFHGITLMPGQQEEGAFAELQALRGSGLKGIGKEASEILPGTHGKGNFAKNLRAASTHEQMEVLINEMIKATAKSHHESTKAVLAEMSKGDIRLEIDGVEVGKVLGRNSKAMQQLTSGVERQANFRAARK